MIAIERQVTMVTAGDVGTRVAGFTTAGADSVLGHVADLIRIPTDNLPGDCAAAATRVASEFDAVAVDRTAVLASQAEGVA